jgi:hypothetical protein
VNRAGSVLFGLLLVASVVVAAIVVHARTPKLELEVLHLPHHKFSPNGDGRHDTAVIQFFVRDSDPNATVQIVGPSKQRIRTLYHGQLTAYKDVTFSWNGRTDAGRLASPHDKYRLRVVLPSQDRDMVYPQQFGLVRTGAK